MNASGWRVAGIAGTAIVLCAACSGSGSSRSGATSSPTPSPTTTATSTPTATPVSTATPPDDLDGTGGNLSHLSFAVVGDTRPALPDDTNSYPIDVITKVWQDVQAEHVPFAVSTGDYVFADPFGDQGPVQMDLYLHARDNFSGPVFYAMGNHECNSLESSNCGPGTLSGNTAMYTAFLTKMMTPLFQTNPYYSIHIDATDGSWTAKLVVIAANAWHDDQKTWLAEEMAKPTTYTFVVRHEPMESTGAPGVPDSNAILAAHPYTLLLAGHTHTYRYDADTKQVITGNGGAPLSSSVNYGYTIIQREDDGTISGANYDYLTHDVIGSFHVDKDGAPVP